ncbi:MAG: type II secretion system protein N [Pseudomonadota bacterium]
MGIRVKTNALSTLNQVLTRIVETAGLITAGVLLGRLFWLIATPEHGVRPITLSPAIQSNWTSRIALTGIDKTLLSSLNPFAESDVIATVPVVDDVPQTSLNLSLRGIRAVTGDGFAAATIVTPDNRQSLYAEGDEILDGVVLSRILSDRIILDKNGTFESLFREGRDGALNVINGEESISQQLTDREVIEPSVFRVPSFESLLGSVRIERTASPDGWRFRALGDPAALASAGINDGDYIVSVAGVPAADLDYDRLSDIILSADRINMAVRRSSQTVQLTIVFEERNP